MTNEERYSLLLQRNYPKDKPELLPIVPILEYFDAPPVLATGMCAEINGYFGASSGYDDDERLKRYSTWMRCLVKMVLKKPVNGKNYNWFEMTLLSRWAALADTHHIMCTDAPDHFPRSLLNALKKASYQTSPDYFRDPFSMHAQLLDQIVELNDKSVWAIRHPIRDIEKQRPTASPDFESMHEISRHTIHISEVLLVTILNFESLREQQRYMHSESIKSHEGKLLLGKEYREGALEYLNFQIQMLKSLRERSISNHSRLSSEITVAYNRIAQQDNRVMNSIAFLTMIFLPAAFISVSLSSLILPIYSNILQSFFSTTFFSFGEDGLQVSKQMWLYWAVTIPSTLIIMIVWRLCLHTKAPLTYHSIKQFGKTRYNRMLKKDNNEKMTV
ncbi:conserved hypothetical protein [Talaromyces stipitatus ATCC 10500]|uniref:CorA family metal ion transporter n=1 Tax=Talaromyces stipitatus (strain ATCC 10500 / CBS 375.48 / QM 6759 / NRRL 1006) TaxID=441959 RepID=B8M2L2_TALSN|nr:uncharacterized protein TSTA_091640 [Talaromyces stipitatus ATCC 10500]EED21923.1 conserved hypothetical protein [Talaromyces stipitatus ATCC 10500]